MDDKDELKPCPFCGGEATHKLGNLEIKETVFCLTCNIALPTKIWQQRAEEKPKP